MKGKNGEWDNDDDPPQRKMPKKMKRSRADTEYETNADDAVDADDPPVADNRQNDAKPNQTNDMPPWRLARLARLQQNSASSVDTPMIRPTCAKTSAPAAAADPGPPGTPSTPQACFADGAAAA